jgi:N-acetylmuramoyl-L-alanine amidase
MKDIKIVNIEKRNFNNSRHQRRWYRLSFPVRLATFIILLVLCSIALYTVLGGDFHPVRALMSAIAPTPSPSPTPQPTATPTPTPTPSPTPTPPPPGKEIKDVVVVVDPGHGGYDPGTVSPYVDGFYEKDIVLDISLRLRKKLEDMGIKVVIDPGHGGSNPGAVYGNVNEKDLNLKVSKILKDKLTASGVTVYMTRTDDRDVGLYTRAEIANKLNADLFISIHHNASPNTSAQGIMTLYYPTANDKVFNGKKLAQIVQKHLVNSLKTRDWGIIPRPNLVVIRQTRMPVSFSNSESSSYKKSYSLFDIISVFCW